VGTETNKTIVRRHFEAVVNQANLNNMEEWGVA
jgi:hypothetical protein